MNPHRRWVLSREPVVVWADEFRVMRAAGYGTNDICHILGCARGTLAAWEIHGSVPNFEDGRAIRRLADQCRAALDGGRILVHTPTAKSRNSDPSSSFSVA